MGEDWLIPFSLSPMPPFRVGSYGEVTKKGPGKQHQVEADVWYPNNDTDSL